MAEGGRIEPGRHAGTPASPTTETRRLVEDGGYAGRHEAPAPVQHADRKCQVCGHDAPHLELSARFVDGWPVESVACEACPEGLCSLPDETPEATNDH